MPSYSNRSARLSLVVIASLVAACSSTTRLASREPQTLLYIKGVERTELPREEVLASKSTGQYEFKAISAQGKTIYGILPLRVSGAKMTTSILFFAPALAIGGFRDPYPFYEFDPDNNQVRFKNKLDDNWTTIEPTQAQSERAKASFEALSRPQSASR